jgi:hypothetical protein
MVLEKRIVERIKKREQFFFFREYDKSEGVVNDDMKNFFFGCCFVDLNHFFF